MAMILILLLCALVLGTYTFSGTRAKPTLVSTTSDASALAEYLMNISDTVQLAVEWHGSVPVSHTISVGNGSTLSVTGFGDAMIDGDGTVRLFTVTDGATLKLTDLSLRGGGALGDDESGGAVFVDSGSLVIAHHCSFSENRVNTTYSSDSYGGE